jgi:hypothetical protein
VCKEHHVALHDIFISYRQGDDTALATMLFYELQTRGLKVFLDSKCLNPGEDWRKGFLCGLANAKMALLLVSA